MRPRASTGPLGVGGIFVECRAAQQLFMGVLGVNSHGHERLTIGGDADRVEQVDHRVSSDLGDFGPWVDKQPLMLDLRAQTSCANRKPMLKSRRRKRGRHGKRRNQNRSEQSFYSAHFVIMTREFLPTSYSF